MNTCTYSSKNDVLSTFFFNYFTNSNILFVYMEGARLKSCVGFNFQVCVRDPSVKDLHTTDIHPQNEG